MPSPVVPGHTAGHFISPRDPAACEARRLKHVTAADFGKLRFSDSARIWLAEHSRGLSDGSIRNYEHHLRWLNQFFADLTLSDIHIGDVEEYQLWRQQPRYDERARRTYRAGYSPINHECSTLHQILDRAGLWTEIEKFYKPLKQPKSRAGQALEEEQLERLFRMAANNPYWKVAYLASLLAVNTTAGPKEIRYLHLSDIALDRIGGDGKPLPTLTIRDGLKNEHRDRTVFLNDTAVMAVRELLARAYRLGSSDPEHFLLPHCAHRRGEAHDPNQPMGSWKAAWRAMCKAAGIKARPYDLRHTPITKLLENPDVAEQTVQELAGHVSKRIKDRYSHIRMFNKREALTAAETKAPVPQLEFGFEDLRMPPLAPKKGPMLVGSRKREGRGNG